MTSIYVTGLEAASGKSAVALGLMELLSRRVERLGFFRPIVSEDRWPDNDVELMQTRYRLPFTADEMVGLRSRTARELFAHQGGDHVMGLVMDKFRRLAARCDAVVCEGTDFTTAGAALELDVNAQSANHLGARVVAVVNGHGRSMQAAQSAARLARRSLLESGCSLLALVVNRVPPPEVEGLAELLRLDPALPEPVWVMPEVPDLAAPTVGQIVEGIGGTVLLGTDDDLNRRVREVKVAGMGLPAMLDHLTVEGTLVVSGGDRAEVFTAALAAGASGAFPSVAAVVAAGGLAPAPQILDMIRRSRKAAFPVVAVDSDTYRTALAIERVRGGIDPSDSTKIATALGAFEAAVDTGELTSQLTVGRSARVTPLMFEYDLVERAVADRRRIVLPEATDPRVLRAAEIVLRRDVADLTLLGDPVEVRELAAGLGVDLAGADVEDPRTSHRLDQFAARYVEARRHKGVTLERARDVMLDIQYFGTMLVLTGAVDGMVSGAATPTGNTIRPALELLREVPDPPGPGEPARPAVVSSVFFMCLPDRVLVYGDCAINVNPTPPQLAEIAIASAGTARRFGVEPRVAMLSYSTGRSGSGADVERVREATELVRTWAPGVPVVGPIQYDAAVDPTVAATKLPDSEVAGRATVFVFPDLDTGNTAYKAVQRSAGAMAVGPVLQGLVKPVNDLSRGCTVGDIVTTVAITAVQAQRGADTVTGPAA